MITKNNETMQKAADSLYQLNSDAVARQCAQSRADAAYWETIKNNKLRYLEEANSQLTQTIDQQASQINQQASRIAELEAASSIHSSEPLIPPCREGFRIMY